MIIHDLEKLGTIKRIDELDRSYETLTPVKQYNQWVMGDGGEFHTLSKKVQWLYIYEIPVGVPRVKISNLSIFSMIDDTDIPLAQEVKNNPSRYAWDVCGFFSIEGEFTDDFKGLGRRMVSNKTIRVEDLKKRERLELSNSVEMDVCTEFFEVNPGKKLYLIVSCASQPVVEAIKYHTEGEYYFLEEPVAEVVNDGDRLSESRIMCGKVAFDGQEIEKGFFLWQASAQKVCSNGMDYKSYKAVFYKPVTRFRPWIRDFRFFTNPKNFIISRKKALHKRLRYYAPVGSFDICVPVNSKKDKRFETYAWSKNLFSDVQDIEKKINLDKAPYAHDNLVNYRSHHEYKNVFDGFTLDEVYTDCESIVQMTPEKAARIIVRNLLRQPKGHRCISLDGNSVLRWLMGGPIRIADEIKMSDDTASYEAKINKAKTEEEKQACQKALDDRIQALRALRYEKDYLYSMVYFGEDDLSAEDKFSGEGFFYYDAPIHFNAPKIKSVPNEIKEKYNKIFEMLYFNPYVHKEGHDVHENISGCEALANLLDKVFKAVAEYGVEIDYVTCDIEMMRNTAHDMKNVHRMALEDKFIDDSRPVYNRPVDADEGEGIEKLKFHRMWNALWNSFEKYKDQDCAHKYREIYNKLQKRGFVVSDPTFRLKSVAITNIYQYGYLFTNNYEIRRNLNIWEQVAIEYYTGVFDKFMMAPIRKYSPKMHCSTHAARESSGYVYYSGEFECYLGGNARLPAKMTSNPTTYGSVSLGVAKHSMDDWRALPSDNSPFAYLLDTVNRVRASTLSNKAKRPQPFIDSVYLWTNSICFGNKLLASSYANCPSTTNGADPNKALRDQFIELCNSKDVSQLAVLCHKYYKELLLHAWLCNPDMMYAYLHYHDHSFRNEKFDHRVFKLSEDGQTAEFKKVLKEEYNQDVYKAIQNAADEMKRITCGHPTRLVTSTLTPEENPFLMTCVRIGRAKLYRFTVNDDANVRISVNRPLPIRPIPLKERTLRRLPVSKRRTIRFMFDDKQVVFRDALLIDGSLSRDSKGFWIAMPCNLAAQVITNAEFYLKNPSIDLKMDSVDFDSVWMKRILRKETNATKTVPARPVTRLIYPGIVSVFGEFARKQKMMTSLRFDKVDVQKTVLGVPFTPTSDRFQPNKEYVFERSYDLDSPQNEEGRVDAPLVCGDFVQPATIAVHSDQDQLINYIDIYSGGPENVSWYKSYIQGMNFHVDLFRESDGVNISRVNKACNAAYANLPVETSCDDKFKLRLSWLNATNKTHRYRITLLFVPVKIKILKRITLCFNVNPGARGYRMVNIPNLLHSSPKLRIGVEHNGVLEKVYNVPINGR